MAAEALILLGLGGGAIWFWLDSARAREMATALATALCGRYGLQFLDGTAALARLGIRWTRQGLRFRRLFRFDYSEAGTGRHQGYLILVGADLEQFGFASRVPVSPADGEQPGEQGPGGLS